MQRLNLADGLPDEVTGEARDITNGEDLPWWLWICNLGCHTNEVIGAGVQRARLAINDREAVFTFSRTDGTECIVRLVGGRRVRVDV